MTMIITTNDKIKEIERELKLRRRCYSTWVLQGRMTQSVADKHIAIMEAILKDYQTILEKENPQGKLL